MLPKKRKEKKFSKHLAYVPDAFRERLTGSLSVMVGHVVIDGWSIG
jgi:hypothetical protein